MMNMLGPKLTNAVVPVDKAEATKLEQFWDDDVHQQTIHKTILTYMMANGIELIPRRGSDSGYLKGHKLISEEKHEPCLRELVAEWHKFGYGAVAYPSEPDPRPVFGGRMIRYPVVVPRVFYELHIETTISFRRRYLVYDLRNITVDNRNMMKPSEDIDIFFMPGHEPDPQTGKHRSLASILFLNGYQKLLLDRYFLISTEMQAQPFMAIENQPDAGGSVELASLTLPSAEAVTGMATPAQKDIAVVQYAQTSAGYGGMDGILIPLDPLEHRTPLEPDPFERNKRRKLMHSSAKKNAHVVNRGFIMARKQPPGAIPQKTIIETEGIERANKFALYQVPEGLAFPTTTNAKSVNHIDKDEFQRFSRTLIGYKKLGVTTDTLMWCRSLDTATLDFEVDIGIPPNATPMQIMAYISGNVIQEDYGNSLLLDSSCIPQHRLFKGKNSNARPLPNASENTVEEMIRARVENIDADSAKKKAEAKAIKAEADGDDNQTEVIKMQMELEEKKAECQIRVIEAKMKELEHATVEKEKQAKSQIEINKSVKIQPKSSAK